MSAINLSLPKELLYTAHFVVSLCQQLPIEEKSLFTQSFGKAVQKHGKSIQRLVKSSYHEYSYRNIIKQAIRTLKHVLKIRFTSNDSKGLGIIQNINLYS